MLSKFVKHILQAQQKQPPPRREDKIPPPTFSTIRAEAEGGYASQLEYLQNNVVTPFLNRAVYENAGQAGEKVPPGVILYGTNISGIAAVATELSLQSGGNYVHFVDGDETAENIAEFYSPYEIGGRIVENAFTEAKKFHTAVIFLPDLDNFYGGYTPTALLTQKMDETRHNTLLIGGTKDKTRAEKFSWRINKLLKYVYIPTFLTPQERREVLLGATSKWGNVLDEDVFRFVVDGTSPPLGEKRGVDEDLQNLAKFAYRRAVERLQEKGGTTLAVIDRSQVHVTLADWKHSLKNVDLLDDAAPQGGFFQSILDARMQMGLSFETMKVIKCAEKEFEIGRKQVQELHGMILRAVKEEGKICPELDLKSATSLEQVVDGIKLFCTKRNVNLLEVRDEWCEEEEESVEITVKIRLPMKNVNEKV
ncbi:uncharacterized protein LOC118433421 [Folsomia candida]|uniref:uncharacterized protein LOC118433421 n=1 Tax=Folsomia candida TaxID=158441 RepID=UPI001604B476|nr:uncharacterized protein LOC118433421 [Folsomia candida]